MLRGDVFMTVVDIVAKEFHLSPNELLRESLKTYLHQRLSKIEADIFLIAKKFGVKDVFELDSKVKNGLVSEQNAYDDYFALDNLEAEREKIKKLLEKV
jgi:hypothetical protein